MTTPNNPNLDRVRCEEFERVAECKDAPGKANIAGRERSEAKAVEELSEYHPARLLEGSNPSALTNFPVHAPAHIQSVAESQSDMQGEAQDGAKATPCGGMDATHSCGGEFNLTNFPVEQSAGTASGGGECSPANPLGVVPGLISRPPVCGGDDRQEQNIPTAGVAPGPLAINSSIPSPSPWTTPNKGLADCIPHTVCQPRFLGVRV